MSNTSKLKTLVGSLIDFFDPWIGAGVIKDIYLSPEVGRRLIHIQMVRA